MSRFFFAVHPHGLFAWIHLHRPFDCDKLPNELQIARSDAHSFIRDNPVYKDASVVDIAQIWHKNPKGPDQSIHCTGTLEARGAPPLPIEFWAFVYVPAKDRIGEWKPVAD